MRAVSGYLLFGPNVTSNPQLRGRRALMLGALAAAGLAGCGSKSTRPKPTELQEFKPSLSPRSAWSMSVGDARTAALKPAVLENALYAVSGDGALVRLTPDNGRVVWQASVGERVSAGVGSDGFAVAVGTPRGEVIVFDAEGKQRWKATVSSAVRAAPLVGRGLVIVRSTDHRINAFEIDGGKRRWTFSRAVPPLTLRAPSAMAFAGETVVVPLPGGRVVALSLINGATRWEANIAEPRGTTEVERLTDVMGTLAVDGRDLCAAAFQGRLTCVDNTNGNLRWARDVPAGAGVAMDSERVYGVDGGDTVVAHARSTGASVWRNTQLAYRTLTSPAALPSAVVVGDFQGYLHFLRPATGELAARIRPDSSAMVAPPQVWANSLIVQSQAGRLERIELAG
jgi:outer membrane protein assembly factor BamB